MRLIPENGSLFLSRRHSSEKGGKKRTVINTGAVGSRVGDFAHARIIYIVRVIYVYDDRLESRRLGLGLESRQWVSGSTTGPPPVADRVLVAVQHSRLRTWRDLRTLSWETSVFGWSKYVGLENVFDGLVEIVI